MVIWDGESVRYFQHIPNHAILANFRHWDYKGIEMVIEKVACYGMPVGEEVFETVFWSGRFAQAYGAERTHQMPRIEVKSHLCHNSRAKDANIRQALIDRFGKPGTKKHPGTLYGITGDLWAALAVAVTWWDKHAKDFFCGSTAELPNPQSLTT